MILQLEHEEDEGTFLRGQSGVSARMPCGEMPSGGGGGTGS